MPLWEAELSVKEKSSETVIVNVIINITLTIMLRKDAHGFAKEICCLRSANPVFLHRAVEVVSDI